MTDPANDLRMLEVLKWLYDRPYGSPAEFVSDKEELGIVSYRFRRLRAAGFIRQCRQGRSRGAIIHYYETTSAGEAALLRARSRMRKLTA
jgi:predicted MarR family transcription regulator